MRILYKHEPAGLPPRDMAMQGFHLNINAGIDSRTEAMRGITFKGRGNSDDQRYVEFLAVKKAFCNAFPNNEYEKFYESAMNRNTKPLEDQVLSEFIMSKFGRNHDQITKIIREISNIIHQHGEGVITIRMGTGSDNWSISGVSFTPEGSGQEERILGQLIDDVKSSINGTTPPAVRPSSLGNDRAFQQAQFWERPSQPNQRQGPRQ